MKIYIASDHAGYSLKEKLKGYFEKKGYTIEDCGAYVLNQDDDYPDFIVKAAEKVANDPGSFGVVLGKSGAGECIVANKVKGIRAFLAVTEENVRLAREHNDCNVISLGSSLLAEKQAKELVDLFLVTLFTNEERHKRRIEKIKYIEEGR